MVSQTEAGAPAQGGSSNMTNRIIGGVLLLPFLAIGVLWLTEAPRERREQEKKQLEQLAGIQADREARRKAPPTAGPEVRATYEHKPNVRDLARLGHLDPRRMPAHERYTWQPDGLVGLLGSHTGRPPGGGSINALGFSPDGRWLVSGGSDAFVRFWEPETLRPALALATPEAGVKGVAFSPDGRLLAACGSVLTRGWLVVWRLADGEVEELATFDWLGTAAVAVAFSPDGSRLAACGGETPPASSYFRPEEPAGHGWAQAWVIRDDALTPEWHYDGAKKAARALAFLPDGQALAVGFDEARVRVIVPVVGALEGPTAQRSLLLWSSVALYGVFVLLLAARVKCRAPGLGRTVRDWALVGTLAAAGLALTVRWMIGQWEPTLCEVQRDIPVPAGVSALAISGDGKLVLAGDQEGTVTRWIIANNRPDMMNRSKKLPTVHALAVTPDGKQVVTGHATWENGDLQVWALDKEMVSRKALLGKHSGARAVAVSPDGKRLVAACVEGVPRPESFRHFHTLGPNRLNQLRGEPIAAQDVVGHERLRLWSLEGKEPEERTPDREGLHVVVTPAEGPLSGHLLTGSPSGQDRRAWQTVDGVLRRVTRSKDLLPPEATPDGRTPHRLLATLEAGKVVVTREVAGGEKAALCEWTPPGPVHRLDFSADGRHLLVSNGNGTVEVVRLDGATLDDQLLASCDAILAADPADASVLWQRGQIYARRGDHARAIADFSALLKAQPNHSGALHQRGISRAERGEHAAAKRDFEAALKIDPGVAHASPTAR